MRNLMLVGTAVTRPGAVGSLYRLKPGGELELAEGIPLDACVQAITPHPTRPEVVYLATRKGLYRSSDGAQSWERLAITPEPVPIWSLAVSPHNPDVLIAGTAPVGFWRSEDAGQSWAQCSGEFPERFQISFGGSRLMRVAFHPTDPNLAYAAAEISGFYISEDGGRHWRSEAQGLSALAALAHLKNTELTTDDTEGMFDGHAVTTTPAKPDAVYYICRMGIFESLDRGKHFRDLAVRSFAPFDYTRECRVIHGQPTSMYACFSISSRSHAGALYRTDDLGASWYRADGAVTARSTMMGFGTHVSDPDGVITVTRGGQVFYTLDGGREWVEKQLPEDAGDAFCSAIL